MATATMAIRAVMRIFLMFPFMGENRLRGILSYSRSQSSAGVLALSELPGRLPACRTLPV